MPIRATPRRRGPTHLGLPLHANQSDPKTQGTYPPWTPTPCQSERPQDAGDLPTLDSHSMPIRATPRRRGPTHLGLPLHANQSDPKTQGTYPPWTPTPCQSERPQDAGDLPTLDSHSMPIRATPRRRGPTHLRLPLHANQSDPKTQETYPPWTPTPCRSERPQDAGDLPTLDSHSMPIRATPRRRRPTHLRLPLHANQSDPKTQGTYPPLTPTPCQSERPQDAGDLPTLDSHSMPIRATPRRRGPTHLGLPLHANQSDPKTQGTYPPWTPTPCQSERPQDAGDLPTLDSHSMPIRATPRRRRPTHLRLPLHANQSDPKTQETYPPWTPTPCQSERPQDAGDLPTLDSHSMPIRATPRRRGPTHLRLPLHANQSDPKTQETYPP